MSEEIENPAKAKGSLKSMFRVEKERLIWIDQARGFVMLFLVLTEFLPDCWKSSCWTSNSAMQALAGFFLDHPGNESAQYINFYDIGVPAFFFIIGLLIAVSFKKRIESHGTGSAVTNSALRWGLFYFLGLMIFFFTWNGPNTMTSNWFGQVQTIDTGVSWYVVAWDVIPALGFVGLAAIPFMFLPSKTRLAIAYCLMTTFQVMLFISQTEMRNYALASVHGGIFGAIFILTPIVLIGSCVGEYFLLDKVTPSSRKYRMLGFFAAINLAIGIGLWLIPGGYPNKRESTMGWATISIAVIIAALFGFIALNSKRPHNTVILEAYGMNPFLMYALCAIPYKIVFYVIGSVAKTTWFPVLYWVIGVVVITVIALILYVKRKAISTTKVIAGVIIILFPIGILAKIFGIL